MMDATRYMLDNTDAFIAKVFEGDQRYIDACSGMIAAHGDKSDQYREYWHSSGMDFKKAQIIYFLTFTKLMERPKHQSKEWVVDNYDKYAPLLP
jgi:hypothetical protein